MDRYGREIAFRSLALVLFFLLFSILALEAEQAPVSTSFKSNLSEARKLALDGRLLESQDKYKKLLSSVSNQKSKSEIQKELEALNVKILFSKTVTPDSLLYEVKSGDTLSQIAKDHHTTIDLIVKSNGLKSLTIYPAMKLKVIKTDFSILVSRSQNKLFLREGNDLIKTYSVATGANASTPLGNFTIENKLTNPTWYRAGAIVPPDSPDNILGTRWLGFSIPGYGIHGTTQPESIGTNASRGCIRMLNEDVEEIYTIVPVKTTVTIVD